MENNRGPGPCPRLPASFPLCSLPPSCSLCLSPLPMPVPPPNSVLPQVRWHSPEPRRAVQENSHLPTGKALEAGKSRDTVPGVDTTAWQPFQAETHGADGPRFTPQHVPKQSQTICLSMVCLVPGKETEKQQRWHTPGCKSERKKRNIRNADWNQERQAAWSATTLHASQA